MKAYLHERRGKTSDIQIRLELTAICSVLEWAVEWARRAGDQPGAHRGLRLRRRNRPRFA
jgi:hypothetical protein